MDEGSRVALIVNPTSGGGRGWRVLGAALPLLRRTGAQLEVVVCTNGDEPASLAHQAVEAGNRLVVAVGGDGQAAAVAEGLIGSDAKLAVLPAGSANDYARSLRIPAADVPAAVAAIAAGRTERLDVIRVAEQDGTRHFLNVVGTGFDAVVAARAERIPILRGAGRYVVALVAELPRFSAATISLTVDGERHQMRAMMVALANGSTYGGGMRIAPSASLTSGELEICVVGEVSKLEFLRTFPRVFRGTHVDHPQVTMLRGREVLIDADRPLQLLGDGEMFGRLPATVTVRPSALEVVVGPAFPGTAGVHPLRRPD